MNKMKTLTEQLNEIGMTMSDCINIVIAGLTLLSVVGVFLTIREMKAERDAAYKPFIVMNPKEYDFSWNSEGKEDWMRKDLKNLVSSEDGETFTMHIPMQLFPSGAEIENYTLMNIGVGTAKNIVFEWPESNLTKLKDYLIECDPTKEVFFTEGEKSDVFDLDNLMIAVDKIEPFQLMYMLPEAEEPYELAFPMQYTLLIHEIIKSKKAERVEIPGLILKAEYEDIQGKKRDTMYYITVDRIFVKEKGKEITMAKYQLSPHIPTGE